MPCLSAAFFLLFLFFFLFFLDVDGGAALRQRKLGERPVHVAPPAPPAVVSMDDCRPDQPVP
eukprot:3660064-Rhodomonas_salina.2